MKKLFIIFGLLVITGCKNDMICKKTIEDDLYKTEEEVIFSFDDNDKISEVSSNHIMIFETEEDAKKYFSVFETIETNYDIELNKKKIIIKYNKNYESYGDDRTKLEESLEKDGYSCK